MEAEGLCPQDRKRKLLLLPPAFGGPVPSLPGRVGHGNGSGHGSPRRNVEESHLPTGGLGGSHLSGLGVCTCLGRRCPRAAGSTRAHKNTLKKKTRNSTEHPKKLVFVLSILHCPQGEDVRSAVTRGRPRKELRSGFEMR